MIGLHRIGWLSRVHVIALNTLREAVRNKLFYAVFFFSVALIATGVVVSTLSYVEGVRIMQDVGMASIRLLGAGFAIFIGASLIHKEIDRRTIYTIVSKPITRAEFLVGKFFGLVTTLWLLLAIMSGTFAVVSSLAGGSIGAAHLAALVLTAVELAIIVAVAALFSAFTTPMLASLFTVGVYVVGHLTRNLRALGQATDSEQLRGVVEFLYRVLPDLEAFNLTMQAAHGLAIPAGQVWLPIAYGFGYVAILLTLASAIFARRDFR